MTYDWVAATAYGVVCVCVGLLVGWLRGHRSRDAEVAGLWKKLSELEAAGIETARLLEGVQTMWLNRTREYNELKAENRDLRERCGEAE